MRGDQQRVRWRPKDRQARLRTWERLALRKLPDAGPAALAESSKLAAKQSAARKENCHGSANRSSPRPFCHPPNRHLGAAVRAGAARTEAAAAPWQASAARRVADMPEIGIAVVGEHGCDRGGAIGAANRPSRTTPARRRPEWMAGSDAAGHRSSGRATRTQRHSQEAQGREPRRRPSRTAPGFAGGRTAAAVPRRRSRSTQLSPAARP